MLKRLTSSRIGLYVYGGSTCSTTSYPIGDVFDPSGTTDSLCENDSFCVVGYACYEVSWKISKIINISSSIGIIVGASVGGLFVCCGIGLCVFFLIIRPRRSKTTIITSGGMGMSPVVNPAGGFPQQQMMMPQQQQQQQSFPYPMHPQQQMMMMPQQQQQMPMSPQMMPMSQQQPQQPQPPQTPA